jgi:type III pantothenate kinase
VNPNVVVDIGNTHIKWGRCNDGAVVAKASLPPDDAGAWQRQRAAWRLEAPASWAVADVHPARRDQLVSWLRASGDEVWLLDSCQLLPLRIDLAQPEKAGMDRLLNAVAVNAMRQPDSAAAIVDAGSAVTVDYVDARGAFRGGAILPGWRLMSQALHDYTALLPLVDFAGAPPAVGTSTVAAIRSGIYWSLVGGIRALLEEMQRAGSGRMEFYLTGGDAPLFADRLAESFPLRVLPLLTLEGIRLAAAGDR